jgi:hypothetical protein
MNVHIAITNELLKATEAVGFYYWILGEEAELNVLFTQTTEKKESQKSVTVKSVQSVGNTMKLFILKIGTDVKNNSISHNNLIVRSGLLKPIQAGDLENLIKS